MILELRINRPPPPPNLLCTTRRRYAYSVHQDQIVKNMQSNLGSTVSDNDRGISRAQHNNISLPARIAQLDRAFDLKTRGQPNKY